MRLDVDVAKLKLIEASFNSQRFMLEDKLRKGLPCVIAQTEQKIQLFEKDAAAAEKTREQDFSITIIVEIKARFDEEANIGWARKLERAGVHVVYGMVGLKTHCKLSLVVRQESEGLRRYCHIGTGNYHPKTARGYEDLGLLTCDREVAQDLTRLFNQLSGYAPRSTFHRLLVAPLSIRDGLIERIQRQIARKKAGEEAWIGIKVNSVVDEAVIDALYRASQAGVPVDVQVRGICAIRAGRSEEHTSELQSPGHLVCRLLLEKKKLP